MTVRISKPEFNLREKLTELDKPSGLKGNELMRSETSQEVRNLIGAGRRNKIINGAMQVSQRGTSESSVTSSGYKKAPDRFRTNISGPTVTVSQSTDSPDGFSNSYKIDITTADTNIGGNDRLILQTRLEGQDLQDFAKGTPSAKDFILSFYCKSTKMGTFTAELEDSDNTGDGGARSVSRHFTISNTEWNRYEINFGADTVGAFDNDNNKSLDIFFWLVAGPSYSGGSSLKDYWAAHIDNRRAYGTSNGADSTSNEFYFTGVQLEVGRNGGNATEFEHRSFAEELALCQRYFQQIKPATNFMQFGVGFTYGNQSDGNSILHIQLTTPMRAAPSFSYLGNLNQYYEPHAATQQSITNMTLVQYDADYKQFDILVVGTTSTQKLMWISTLNNTDTGLLFDAEL